MSMICCDTCSRYIDTDVDPDCFVKERVYCGSCRESRQGWTEEIRIVFDGPPGPEAGRFVEVENDQGQSIRVGEWHEGKGGFWELRIEALTD